QQGLLHYQSQSGRWQESLGGTALLLGARSQSRLWLLACDPTRAVLSEAWLLRLDCISGLVARWRLPASDFDGRRESPAGLHVAPDGAVWLTVASRTAQHGGGFYRLEPRKGAWSAFPADLETDLRPVPDAAIAALLTCSHRGQNLYPVCMA